MGLTGNFSKVNLLGKKIIFAEDDEASRLILSYYFDQFGCQVVCVCQNGLELLNFVNDDTIKELNFIILDSKMPSMNGVECMKELKRRFSILPPIIVITADAMSESKAYFLGQGFDDYISKPMTMDIVKQVLMSWSD